jgi:hypothetical protein
MKRHLVRAPAPRRSGRGAGAFLSDSVLEMGDEAIALAIPHLDKVAVFVADGLDGCGGGLEVERPRVRHRQRSEIFSLPVRSSSIHGGVVVDHALACLDSVPSLTVEWIASASSLITPSSMPEAKNSRSNVAASASIACHAGVKRLSLFSGLIEPVDELCGDGVMHNVSRDASLLFDRGCSARP